MDVTEVLVITVGDGEKKPICKSCPQYSYRDSGRKTECYGFCKIKCSWTTDNALCESVPVGRHEHFKKYPYEIRKIVTDFYKWQQQNPHIPTQTFCVECGSNNCYHISRVVGYFSIIENWNRSKKAELKRRQRGNYWHDSE